MSDWYYGTEQDLNELQHYGVLGMKWGHRKSRGTSSRKSNTKTKRKLTDKQKRRRKLIKSMHDMR